MFVACGIWCLADVYTISHRQQTYHINLVDQTHILTPRVDREFIPQNVSPAFVLLGLRKLKSTKATGLDGIPARLLKVAAQEVTKPIANLINLTFSTGEIPQEWK